MADRASGTRGAVPIALGSAASGTEEGREFFQGRLGALRRVDRRDLRRLLRRLRAADAGSARTSASPAVSRSETPTSITWLATLVAGALWVVARPRWRVSMRTLEWLEAIGTVLMCACFALMAIGFVQAHLAVAQDPMHGISAA